MQARPSSLKSLQRLCPICKAGSGVLIFEQRFARIEGVSIHGGYDVVSCATCGGCFADGVPEQSAFDRYYREASKYEGGGAGAALPEHTLERFRQEVADIERFTPERDARVLEIGCATGALLSIMKERGYGNVQGLDPSPACAAVARDHYGINVRTGDIGSELSGSASFDLIVLIAVLEHVRDIQGTLALLRSALAPGGKLFIEVPNASSFHKVSDAGFQEFSVEHINFFSTQSLASVMQAHGFRCIDVFERERAYTNDGIAPVVTGIFGLDDSTDAASSIRDTITADALRSYIEVSRQREQDVLACVAELARTRKPLLVWGCGTLTLRLLATSELGQANIRGFVDSNPRYAGHFINGIPILDPVQVAQRQEAILISSVGMQGTIAEHIRERLRYEHELILYPSA